LSPQSGQLTDGHSTHPLACVAVAFTEETKDDPADDDIAVDCLFCSLLAELSGE